MTIPTLPTPPSRSDSPETFAARADALLGALPSFVTEANALQGEVQANKNYVESAWTAAGGITVGLGQAVAAASQAAAAKDAAIAAWAASTAPAETLAALSQSLHSGAIVKAIVYDTTKDSDGGAWRKRCTDKSWYTETICTGKWLGQKTNATTAWATAGAVTGDYYQNTTDGKYYTLGASSPTVAEVFRGNTREFPAVVAVVAESARVVIYDLTASGAPMWMAFSSTGYGFVTFNLAGIACVNGRLYIAGAGQAIRSADFVTDYGIVKTNVADARSTQNIAGRNIAATAFGPTLGTNYIVNATVNDIAVTVLDNAPIDPATGLPVPTIAVATEGGVSWIRHDGTVVNDTSVAGSVIAKNIAFLPNGRLVRNWNDAANRIGVYMGSDVVPAASFSATTPYHLYFTALAAGVAPQIPSSMSGLFQSVSGGMASGATAGFLRTRLNYADRTKTMLAAITNAYTSGWQVGNSLGAWLADTVAESITAAELAAATYATSPAYDNTTTPVSASSFTQTAGTTASRSYLNITTVVGKTYQVTYRLDSISANNMQMFARDASNGGGNSIATATLLTGAGQSTTLQFTATTTTSSILWVSSASAVSSSIDSISVKLADADRSVKANGLNIVGTITKTAVATGAQLVRYSGFGPTNYLEQPYTANLDFGTGDFCLMWWESLGSTSDQVRRFSRGVVGGAGYFGALSGGTLTHQLGILSGGVVNSGIAQTLGYNLIAWVREAGTVKLYINGVLAYSVANSTNLTDAGAVLRVGTDTGTTPVWNGPLYMALWRISATAPSADQIAHIYRTELPLFQPNAQCTIAGTSAAVTALAYDDSTDEVHVGTSWGRSEFRDLIRVASEATAVGSVTSVAAQGGIVLTGGTSGRVYVPAMLLRDELRRKDEARKALGRIPVFFEFDTASFTASPSSGSPTLTASAIVGTPYVGMGITGSGIPAGTTLIAINGTTYTMSANASSSPGSVTIAQSGYRLQQGYEVKAVYSAGTLKRVGTTKDYTVSNDGFADVVTFGTSPGSAVWVSIMAVRK